MKPPQAYNYAQLSWFLQMGFFSAALRDLEASESNAELTPEATLIKALALKGRGEIWQAHTLLLGLLNQPEAVGENAFFALIETEALLGEWDRISALLVEREHCLRSPRGRLFSGRALVKSDPQSGLERLLEIANDEECPASIRRLAGFDAVRILDSFGRFRESLELANRFHRSFTGQDATQHLLGHLDLQLDAILKGAFPRRQTNQIERTSILVGLPRSGTTLLEQMLDNHPEIQAIGEFDGLKEIIHTMTSQNVSPYQLLQLDERSVEALRGIYCNGARRFETKGMPWTLDKSLLNWTSLPFLAQLLPGARYIYIRRDPRDLAISLLLSWFDYEQFPWVSKMSDLYQVIFRSHALLPKCLHSFGVEFAQISYEDLVSNTISAISKCLDLLELEHFAGTLSPLNNMRPANTLSFEQVKRPLYQDSIGRWKNYEWLFDDDWHRLAESAGY